MSKISKTTEELSDDAARAAAKDLERTFLVEASAGTGKTELLCARALAALRKPGVRPASVVAITFTERAAAELAARLRQRLEEAAHGASRDEQLARALADFDQAQISTIHSFATTLLRERPVEAAVDPAFAVADELAAAVAWRDVWEEWLREEASRPAGPAAWATLWERTGKPRRDLLTWIPETLVKEYAGAQDAAAYPPGALADLRDTLTEALSYFREAKESCARADDPLYVSYGEVEALARALEGGDAAAVAAFALGTGTRGHAKNWPEESVKNKLLALRGEVKEALKAAKEEIRGAVLPPFVAWLGGAARAYRERKEGRAELDFNDLLVRALELVRRKDVREYFQKNYRYILVDEFQDTDPVQAELVFYLAEAGAEADDWREVDLVPGKLFVVGDAKQSIYRFRRADIEVYAAARDVIERNGGEVLTLTDNFRAGPKLISFTNAAFQPLFEDGRQPYQAPYGELRTSPATRARQAAAPGVYLLEGPREPFSDKEEAAAAVAAFIRRVVTDENVEVYDKEEERCRPVLYRDFALLFWKFTELRMWEEQLERWHVPFYAVGGRSFYGRPEVKAMAAAARAIDNPNAAVAFVAALSSPLFSFTADELLRLKLAGGAFDYRREVPAAAPARFRPAFDFLRGLHERCRDRSAAATLEELVAETALQTKARLWGDGVRAVANIRQVLTLARQLAAAGDVGLRTFAEWLGEMEKSEEAARESPALEPGDEFVRLSTIHGAKGLEFNVVVLPDLAWAKPRNDYKFYDRAAGLVHLSINGADGRMRTPGYNDAVAEERLFAAAEGRRVLYVAATRARDLLVIPQVAGTRTETLGAALAAVIPRADVTTVHIDGAAAAPPEVSAPAQAPPDIKGEVEKWRAGLKSAVEQGSAVATAVVGATTVARAGEDEEDERGPLSRPGRGDGAARGLALGRALHAVMEEVDLAAGTGLDALAREKCAAEGCAADAALVAGWARNCLAAGPVVEAAAAPACYRELPFWSEIAGVVVNGWVDLAFESPRGLVIVDYKTDEPTTATARAAGEYRRQLAVYAAALARVTGGAVAGAYLVFAAAAEGERVIDLGAGEKLVAEGLKTLADYTILR